MAATKYTYSISVDFPSGKVSTDRLDKEIRDSSIVTALDYLSTSGDVCDVWFKDVLSGADNTTLDGLVAVHDGTPLPDNTVAKVELSDASGTALKLDSSNRIRSSSEKVRLSSATLYSHDWTDPTTWYTSAVRVVDEVATDSGDQLTYMLAHDKVIDVYHGKILGEDFLLDSSANSYRAVVKVNDVTKTEQDPHTGAGGDYTVDYATGSVTFLSALNPADVVKVTYHYVTDSLFVLKPGSGKNLIIDAVEVQFSADVELTDSIFFQAMGLVDVFAPQLVPTPYPSGTLIPISDPLIYKTMTDYQADARRAYPAYPALGGSSWRGSQQPIHVLTWDYQGQKELLSAAGMELRLYLEHDTPFGGSYASATFYCFSESAG